MKQVVEILFFCNIIGVYYVAKGDCMNFLRNLGARIVSGMRRFMMGRYGSDKLNTALLMTGVVICLISAIVPFALVKLIAMALCYGLMFWAISRMFSRNTYKRYQENRKYLQFLERIKDRQHRYYDCPRCRQQVRVPRERERFPLPARNAEKSLSKKHKRTQQRPFLM